MEPRIPIISTDGRRWRLAAAVAVWLFPHQHENPLSGGTLFVIATKYRGRLASVMIAINIIFIEILYLPST